MPHGHTAYRRRSHEQAEIWHPTACGEHRRQQTTQLTVKFPQPGAIFYDGPGGHLLILTRHKA
jgi:hypothetical protein